MIQKAIILLALILLLVGCQTVDDIAAPVGDEHPVDLPTQEPSLTSSPVESLISTTTPMPEISDTPFSTTTPTSTDLAPTGEITSTPSVSRTVVTSFTSVITEAWVHTDFLVARNAVVHHVAWDREASRFSAATSVGLFVYDGQSLDPERSFNIGEPVRSVAFSPDDGLLVFGRQNGDIEWLSPETGRYFTTFEGHQLGINDLAFPGTSLYMVSGGDDGRVMAWNPTLFNNPANTGVTPINTWRTADRVTCVDISQNLQLVVAGSYQTWYAWDLFSGSAIFETNGLNSWISDVSINPGGQNLAVADSSNRIYLWDTLNWELTHSIPLGQVDQVTALDFSSDGGLLAIGAQNGVVVLWDLVANTLTVIGNPYPHSVTDIAFYPDGFGLLISYKNGNLRYMSRQPQP